MKLTNIPPIENYREVSRSLRICAKWVDEEEEACKGCIYETESRGCETKILYRAACAIEDLCELVSVKEKEDESVREMQMETDLHAVRPEPVQAETGLGKTSEEVQKETSPLDKLSADLRAGWEWLDDDMPIPDDIRPNMLKAAKVLEIMSGALQMTEVIRVSALAAIGEALK